MIMPEGDWAQQQHLAGCLLMPAGLPMLTLL
jgi:hypothetical protein